MKKPVAAYYHTHWDREWYLPFRTYQLRLADVVDEVLLRLENNELPCFTLDGQVAVLDDYLEIRPGNRERLHTLIAAGRIDIGPWLVMPDEFLVGGESLLRNLAVGIARSKELGCHQFTGYLPDTFGHSADIPLLLKGVGIQSAIVWRGIQPKRSLFHWVGPSGASVATLHLTDGYFQIPLDDWAVSSQQRIAALEALLAKLDDARTEGVPVLLPMGGDHMGALPPQARHSLLGHLPDLLETTPVAYMRHVMDAQNASPRDSDDTESVRGEMADHQGSFLLPGVWSSRLYLKQENRRLEHELLHRLEPMLAIAQSLSLQPGQASENRYPNTELALAWHLLMMNHPHDSICGCSVDEVHRENETRFDQVRQIAVSLIDRAQERIADKLPGAKAFGWVINTGDRPYTGVIPVMEWGEPEEFMPQAPVPSPMSITDADLPDTLLATQLDSVMLDLQDEYRHNAHRIPMSHLTRRVYHGWRWVENIPAYGVRAFSPQEEGTLPPAIASVQASEKSLGNGLIQVDVQPDGTLAVSDLATGHRATGFLSFTLQRDQGDSYTGAPVPGDIPVLAAFENARTESSGPLVGSVVLTHILPVPKLAGSMETTCESELLLTTVVSLMAGSQQLGFETRFTNRTLTAHKLQVAFKTGKPVREVVAESHFSCVVRSYDPDYRPQDHMPVAPWKELKSNTGPVQRFFSANGHSWLTEGLTEYEVDGEEIRITLLRAFTALSAVDTGVRGAQAGPPLSTKGGACIDRPLACRYGWMPTPLAVATLYEAANRFYGQTQGYGPDCQLNPSPSSVSHQISGNSFSLLQWDNTAVIATACYWLPARGLLIRLHNTTEDDASFLFQAGFAYRRLQQVNFLNEAQGDAIPDEQVARLTLAPLDTQTFIFEMGYA